MSLEQLLKKLRHLKYGLKRLEYDAEDPNVEWDWGRYTKYAILDVCDRYVLDKDKVLEKMGEKDLIAL